MFLIRTSVTVFKLLLLSDVGGTTCHIYIGKMRDFAPGARTVCFTLPDTFSKAMYAVVLVKYTHCLFGLKISFMVICLFPWRVCGCCSSSVMSFSVTTFHKERSGSMRWTPHLSKTISARTFDKKIQGSLRHRTSHILSQLFCKFK